MTNNNFQQRITAWKQLILSDMIKQINNDPNKSPSQRIKDKTLLNGALGDRLITNRICLALGISERQFIRRLVKVHSVKPRKPPVIR